jgi:Family of unknown function (DUF5677)
MSLEEDKLVISNGFIEAINVSNIELFRIIKESFEELRRLYPLIEFIIERLSAVTDLALSGGNWDAEIIYRSALEGLLKFVFIASAKGEERDNRLREFWEDLSEINSIKMSEQAKRVLKVAEKDKTETFKMAFRPLVLSDEDEKTLREKWPVSKRKGVERKWSFSEIIISMSATAPADETPDYLAGLAHNYRYASHVTHADETGILIIRERRQRPQEERQVADFAHFIRLLSDSFYMCIAMGLYVSIYINKSHKFFSQLAESMKDVHELGEKYLQYLQQDPSYDKYRDDK